MLHCNCIKCSSIDNAIYQLRYALAENDISSLFYNFLSATLPKKLKICLVVSCSIYYK